MLTATAMGYFEDEIAKAVVLALFVPLIISSGGNSGSQATTLVIRAMALGEVRLRTGGASCGGSCRPAWRWAASWGDRRCAHPGCGRRSATLRRSTLC